MPTSSGCAFWTGQQWNQSCLLGNSSDQTTTQCTCSSIGPFLAAINILKIDTLLESINEIYENIKNEIDIQKETWIITLNNVTNIISQSLEINNTVTVVNSKSLTNVSVDVLDILINQPKVWNDLELKEQIRSSSAILGSIEHLSVLLNLNQIDNFNAIGKYNNIELKTKKMKVEIDNLVFFNFKDFTIEFSSTAFNNSIGMNITSTAATIRNLSSYTSEVENVLVYSRILSLVVENKTGTVNLSDGQYVKFKAPFCNKKKLIFGSKVRCSYWDFEHLTWSTDGCEYLESQSSRRSSTCQCNHTTNFAVLIDVNNEETDDLTKSILSYTSSGFTILCAASSIYALFKQTDRNIFDFQKKRLKGKSNRAKINLHIACWLIASHLLVLFTLDQNGIIFKHLEDSSQLDKGWKTLYCSVSSLLLLYCLLTTFSIMLLINYHLYVSIVKPISRFQFKKFFIAAYLYPVVIVLASVLYIYLIELVKFENLFDQGFSWKKIWKFMQQFFNFTDTQRWEKTAQSLYGNFL